jgi:hypothetical protein
VVATSHQAIRDQAIDAGGCDIGIYVGEGVSHVTIDSVTVSRASFQGILAEKTSHLTVERSTLTNNGDKTIDPSAPPLPGNGLKSFVGQSFAISLFGVSHVTVADNKVFDNGRGGIGIMDNGPNDPGTITQDHSAATVPSSDVRVMGNTLRQNYGGCAIVLATQNLGGRLSHLSVTGNTVTGTGLSTVHGPDVGGLVVAADLPGSTVSDVRISGNTVTGSFEGGVIVNAEAFNSSTKNVRITGNTASANNQGHMEAPNTAGIIVFANPKATVPPHTTAPRNVGTLVARNTLSDQFYGIWSAGDFAPRTFLNHIAVSAGGVPIFPAPARPHFTLSPTQLAVNQRIGQAAIRRLNAAQAMLDGRPASTAGRHAAGTVRLSATQLLINQRIYQAAIRRAATLEARLDHKPAPHFGPGQGGTVHLNLGQLIINQRIAQAAVRRANALVARVG